MVSRMTVYVEEPTPVSVIVARVCIGVFSVPVVLFGGFLTLIWLGVDWTSCQPIGCQPSYWPGILPVALSLACALVAVAATFLASRASIAWTAGLVALGGGTVCPVLVLGWI